MAKTIDADLLQKERDELEKSLMQARQNVESAKNQVMSVIGAIQMTDRLIEISKDGNYSKSRANSEGVPEGNAAEVQKSLEELGLHCQDFHVLGVFEADPARERKS